MNQNLANESLQMNWAMAVLAPLTLFPATSAMFTVVRKWVMGDTDTGVFRTFFKGYKENYKQSLIGGIFYTFTVCHHVCGLYRIYDTTQQLANRGRNYAYSYHYFACVYV